MMVNDLQRVARAMLADFDARTPGQFSVEAREMTAIQAYALQAEITRLREQRGESVIGYKVGCTSRPIQLQLGVTEPIFGRLFDTGCYPSGVQLASSRFANLAVEGEMAVRLSRDLPPEPLSAEECREAIAEVFPVIELHHHVVPDAWPPAQWLIASNGMHAGFVLAESQSRGPCSANVAHNLSIRINETVVGAVELPALLAWPIESLRWLAGRLATFGLKLRKDHVILTGSPMNLYPVSPGSRIVVEAPPLGASCVEIDV